jgi:hypothetical protein
MILNTSMQPVYLCSEDIRLQEEVVLCMSSLKGSNFFTEIKAVYFNCTLHFLTGNLSRVLLSNKNTFLKWQSNFICYILLFHGPNKIIIKKKRRD